LRALSLLIFNRTDVETTLLRAGALFQQTPEGRISNLYTMKMFNKTSHDVQVELRLEGFEGTIRVLGQGTAVPAQKLTEGSVLIETEVKNLKGPTTPMVVGVYANGKLLNRVKTVFVGPRANTP
jgi:hypothetical protein